METSIKKLKIKGLHVISIKAGSYRYCKLMSDHYNIPVRAYTKNPILKITDFIKLFNESLKNLDWDKKDILTPEHGKAIKEMEEKIKMISAGRLIVEL